MHNNAEYCIYCGQNFVGRRGQMFCSKKCRYKYYHNSKLILPIKKKWFDIILSGEKAEEYREMKPYWEKRFLNYFGKHWSFGLNESEILWNNEAKPVVFRNGYSENSPTFTAMCTIDEGTGNPEWGAEPGKMYYRIHIKQIL